MIHAWPPKGNMLTIHLRNIALLLLLLKAGFPQVWKILIFPEKSGNVWICLDFLMIEIFLSGFVWNFDICLFPKNITNMFHRFSRFVAFQGTKFQNFL